MKPRTLALAAFLASVAMPPAAVAQDASKGDGVSVQAIDPAKLEEARAIMAIAFPPDQQEATLDQILAAVLSQVDQSFARPDVQDPGLQRIVAQFHQQLPAKLIPLAKQHLPKIIDATAQAYTREFSLAELKSVHAFASSPAGGHFLARSPLLVADPAVASANLEYLKALSGLRDAVLKDFLQEVRDYLLDKPDLQRRLSVTVDS